MSMIEVVASNGPALLLRAQGRLNMLSASMFEADAVRAMASTKSDVVIDASDVTYLSSAGLRVFLRLSRRLSKSDRSLRICSLKPYILEVFEIIGFDKVIPIHSDLASALSASASQPQSQSL